LFNRDWQDEQIQGYEVARYKEEKIEDCKGTIFIL
jgi:hypothetical protein